MPKHNYKARLQNLSNRRTDIALNKAFLTESFRKAGLPETVRYVFESMNAIEPSYTKKTYEEAERVQNQIKNGLSPSVSIEFQYQGSVPLNTHIRLHSDLDILTVHKGFHGLEPPLTPSLPYSNESATRDLRELRTNIYSTLSSAFPKATVDNSIPKAISIKGGSLARKFDIIVCNWYETVLYNSAYFKTNALRGIQIYDKKQDTRLNADYPFAHIEKVEEKNKRTMSENYKRVIRLLKSLKADADVDINLSSFMITSVMYHMEDYKYSPDVQNSTALLTSTSEHLERIIENYQYRQSLDSPNGKEKLFAQDDSKKVAEFRKLKKELDDTIEDMAEEIRPGIRYLNEQFGRHAVKDYYEPLQKARYIY
jgi:hypothetical protein